METKAVIFDVDGVLLDSFEANFTFYQNLMITAGYAPVQKENFHTFFHLTMKEAITIMTNDASEKEINRIWQMGKTRAIPYPIDKLAIPAHAEKIIKSLAKKYKLGIVTGRIKESVYEFPKLAELKKYFSAVIAYEDTALHKPHPEPLLLATKKLGVQPSQAIYIGDTENDMIAARAAGLKCILYAAKKFTEADGHAFSFEALPSMISSL